MPEVPALPSPARSSPPNVHRPCAAHVREALRGVEGPWAIRSPPVTTAAETLRRTPLYDRHQAAGARIVPFAGWEMPVQYEGVRQEHIAVRRHAGLFDVSHMGEIETSGPDAEAFLQRVLSNDVSKIAADGAQYSVLCREDGGVLDDLFTYSFGSNRYLTVTNAANHAKDLAWFREQAEPFDVTIDDSAGRY